MTTITLPLSPGRHYGDCVDAEIVDVAPHLAHIATLQSMIAAATVGL